MAWNQDFGAGANPGTNNTAWRENFNAGWAAGDFTGNHNAQILAEKLVKSGGSLSQTERDNAPANLKPVIDVIGATVKPRPGAQTVGGPAGGGALTGQAPVVHITPEVLAAAKRTLTQLPQVTGLNGFTWGGVGAALTNLWAGGPNAHPLATAPKKHEQAIVGGHNVVHDLGWSPMEVIEDIWGDAEFLTPTWFYSWGKMLADTQKTAEAANLPGPKDALDALHSGQTNYTATPTQGDPFWDAGNTVRNWAQDKWKEAEGGWNSLVTFANNAVPLSNSSPGPRNPYANSNAYPF